MSDTSSIYPLPYIIFDVTNTNVDSVRHRSTRSRLLQNKQKLLLLLTNLLIHFINILYFNPLHLSISFISTFEASRRNIIDFYFHPYYILLSDLYLPLSSLSTLHKYILISLHERVKHFYLDTCHRVRFNKYFTNGTK